MEAIRDQAILEENGIKSEIIPYYKSPSFYTGDNQVSELLVMDYEVEKARKILGIKDVEEEN
jgi:hypothetical protein